MKANKRSYMKQYEEEKRRREVEHGHGTRSGSMDAKRS